MRLDKLKEMLALHPELSKLNVYDIICKLVLNPQESEKLEAWLCRKDPLIRDLRKKNPKVSLLYILETAASRMEKDN